MDRWEVRLIDFGLAVRQQTAGKSVLCPPDSRSASDRSYAGTFKYAPPEQKNEADPISGKVEKVGPYSDVYTFGKTFCEALFGTTSPKGFHYDKLPENYQPLRDLLERCTADAVEERFADFGEVLAKLDALDPLRREREEQEREQKRLEADRLKQEQKERLRREEEASKVEETATLKQELTEMRAPRGAAGCCRSAPTTTSELRPFSPKNRTDGPMVWRQRRPLGVTIGPGERRKPCARTNRWRLVECPPAKSWANRVGDSCVEFVEGTLELDCLSLRGYRVDDKT